MTDPEIPGTPENPDSHVSADDVTPPTAHAADAAHGEVSREVIPEPIVIRKAIGESRAEAKADQDAVEEASGKLTLWRPRKKSGAEIATLDHYELGWRIFRWLIVLTGVLAFMFGVFAFATYPRFNEVTQLIGNATADDPLKAYRELRQEWIGQMVTVGQMIVFGSLVPLVATTVGYLLGQGKKDNGNS